LKLLYLLGAGGVEYWRCRIPALAMQKHGLAEIRIIERQHLSAKEMGEALAWCDVITVASPQGISSLVGLMKYRSLGKKVIVDYDDYILEVSPYNAAYRVIGLEEVYIEDTVTHEKSQLWKDGENGFDIKRNYMGLKAMKDILNNVDMVTTTTLYLKEKWAAHMIDPSKIKVLPNGVDFARWRNPFPKNHEGFRIGYVCSASHAEDWMRVAPAIHYFLEKHKDAKLVVMGDVGFDLKGRIPADQLEWHGWSDLLNGHYMLKVASLDLDVAIMPLEHNEFNRCKSPLKYVEMTAFGYPVIAERTLPYTEDIVSGENGLLAGTTEEWLAALQRVYDSNELRLKMRFNALLTCREWYDIDKVCFDWAKAYSETLGELIYAKS